MIENLKNNFLLFVCTENLYVRTTKNHKRSVDRNGCAFYFLFFLGGGGEGLADDVVAAWGSGGEDEGKEEMIEAV